MGFKVLVKSKLFHQNFQTRSVIGRQQGSIESEAKLGV